MITVYLTFFKKKKKLTTLFFDNQISSVTVSIKTETCIRLTTTLYGNDIIKTKYLTKFCALIKKKHLNKIIKKGIDSIVRRMEFF